MKRISACLAVVLLVAGCAEPVATPSISAPKGVTAKQAMDGFAVTVGMAEAIGNVCKPFGVARNYTDARAVSGVFVQNLSKQGYPISEVLSASQNINTRAAVVKATAYLKKRGAREGDPESFCNVGKAEIAKQTPLGKLLRRV